MFHPKNPIYAVAVSSSETFSTSVVASSTLAASSSAFAASPFAGAPLGAPAAEAKEKPSFLKL